ncbi:MAG: hypothetical protein AABW89_01045 [Nanoarchaeota archaeon]
MKTESFIEGIVSLIPQQTVRFITYSLLTVGIFYFFRLMEAE